MSLAGDAPFHVAVFAKAPQPGQTKTRLIPLLGPQGAATAQRAMARRTLGTACTAAPGQVSLWTAGDRSHDFFTECGRDFGVACQPQAGADLGARMADCLRRSLRRQRTVLLIGTDCPVLRAADLQAAAQALQDGARMVFTPAEDGGYVLVGAQAGEAELLAAGLAQAFAAIDWGSAQVMAQTRQRLRADGWQPGRDWQEMPALWDVDTPADYLRAQRLGLIDT